MDARLDTTQTPPVLRLERFLAVPGPQLWAALTEPGQLGQWFPAQVRVELSVGGEITFDQDGDVSRGVVEDVQAGRVVAYTWGESRLCWQITPGEGGCTLGLSQTLDAESGGALAAAQHAAGWEMCFDDLERLLNPGAIPAATEPEDRTLGAPSADLMLPRLEAHVRGFGLDMGAIAPSADGYTVTFTRHLTWRPVEEVWAVLVTGSLDATADDVTEQPTRGERPPWPTRNGYLEANEITRAEPPHLLEYDWLARGESAGRVRWQLKRSGIVGTAVTLTQTLPAHLADRQALHLAAWHTHLELLFAALAGELRLPWPEERTDELQEEYARRLRSRGHGEVLADTASADGA